MIKRKCPACKGSKDLVVTSGRFKWLRVLWRKIIIQHIQCWQCKGKGKIFIEEDHHLEEVPPHWLEETLDIGTFLCPDCYDEGILSVRRISDELFEGFSLNEIRLRCFRCHFCMPQYKQSGGHATENIWIPIVLLVPPFETFKLYSNCSEKSDDEYTEPNE